MDISLIIPAYNEEEYIGACLDSIEKHMKDKFKEVIVVDNGSTDQTAQIAARYPWVRVVQESRKGLTSARQAGFEASTSPLLAYTDADCRFPENWFHNAEKLITQYPDAVSWSGAVYYYDAPNVVWRLVLNAGWWMTAPITYRCVGYMVLGGNFIVRRDAIERIGGFERAISFYGEDTTLAKRLNAIGRTIFSMRFYTYTSMRRFAKEGYVTTNMRYVMNYVWPTVFGRPYHRSYTDVR